ncbi:MAG: sigma-70 family RNA polymerase sigma factor [Calditrichaeota bacterium]|nr:sigma-70 family RNA polymerase sigma factor [Calditrichota bacterium]MCB0268181.1 sigma-70 family RNA polymerase sigma factor [Calditrichota bacterium]MCB0298606.1 sigma-70 family RNA polymerase sigma factor [Calditrichota bacterium]MCB9067949.1 sigma-70 family RNA polymerase sigma factor [Calditrichia bacterium]
MPQNFDTVSEKLQSATDDELIERLKSGQSQALSVLYDRYASQLYGLSLKILQNQSLAQDVIQEVFLSIWKNAKQFDRKRGAPMAWMTILCRNRCIDILRSKDTQTKRSAFSADDEIGNPALISEVEESPLHLADLSQLQNTVKTALAALPDDQRDLLELAYFQGFSQSEIAKKRELPLGTVKTRIRSGMLRLREIFTRIGIE